MPAPPLPCTVLRVPLLSTPGSHSSPKRSFRVSLLPSSVLSSPYSSPDLVSVGQKPQAGVLAQESSHIRRWFVHDVKHPSDAAAPTWGRAPSRKQISLSRKCSKMAAVMAFAVLRQRMMRWPQSSYAGLVSTGPGRTLPKRGRENRAENGMGSRRTLPKKICLGSSGTGLDSVRCSRLASLSLLSPVPCWVPVGPAPSCQRERPWIFFPLR